jgi:hypothetical protein
MIVVVALIGLIVLMPVLAFWPLAALHNPHRCRTTRVGGLIKCQTVLKPHTVTKFMLDVEV